MSADYSLDLTLAAAEIEREPRRYTLSATEDELKVLAERFGLVVMKSLDAVVTVQAEGADNEIIVSGTIKSDLVQRCIASLKEVPETVDTDFTLLLVDPDTANRLDADESYLDPEAPEYDALEGDKVDIGEIVAQTIAVSMNPYPRADGASVEVGNKAYVTVDEPELEKKNPFAVLEKLKDES